MAETTNSIWHTPFGNLNPNQDLIYNLNNIQGVGLDTNLFRLEHGIFTLIPFTKKAFPNAQVLPLVLRQNNNYLYFYNLGKKLSETTDLKHTVLIISSDFSHNVSIKTALENDQKSIKLLPSKKLEDVNAITNDCKQCTALLFGYLNNKNTNFKLIYNKNSFDLSGQNPGDVTSYVGAYFTQQ
jgi:AmmeMemoRadiSam system protein B